MAGKERGVWRTAASAWPVTYATARRGDSDATLDTATGAVEAGKARTLAPEFCALELQQLRDEREWLAKVEWR
jgi:hypothetical protein